MRVRWMFVVLLLAWSAGIAGAASDPPGAETRTEVIAVFAGGEIHRGDYQSWRAVHDLEDSREAIREMAFALTLAAADGSRQAAAGPDLTVALEAMRQRVLIPALHRHVTSEVTVSDKEVTAFLESNPETLVRPRKMRLSQLFKAVDTPGDLAAVRAAMTELHRRLLDGADLEELARTESESQSRFRGGSIGFVDPRTLPGPVADAVRGLAVGELTGLVEHGDGISIFRCEEIRPARNPPPAERRAAVRARLLRHSARVAWNEYREQLLREAGVRIDLTADAPALEMEGYRLDAAAIEAVISRLAPDSASGGSHGPEAHRILEQWATNVACVRQAQKLGLDGAPVTAAALRWGEIGVRARHELVRRVDGRLQAPTEDELRDAWADKPDRYRTQPAVELSAIHIAPEPQGWTEEQLVQARFLERRLRQGELSFDEAARAESDHASASEGGRLGWVSQRRVAAFGPVAVRALAEIEPGQMTDLLHLESGLWIFKLHGRRVSRTLSFEEARDEVEADIRAERIRELENEVRTEILAEIEPRIVAHASSSALERTPAPDTAPDGTAPGAKADADWSRDQAASVGRDQ